MPIWNFKPSKETYQNKDGLDKAKLSLPSQAPQKEVLRADHERSEEKNYEQKILVKPKQTDSNNITWNNEIFTWKL